MNFPSDIKNAMRDCILKIFWAKNDIVEFFINNGCTTSDIKKLGDYKSYNRKQIIDKMYKILSSKTDEGLGPFRSLLHSLVNWSYFDSYYFNELEKLSVEEAEIAIDHLKQLQEIRDSKLTEMRKARELKDNISKSTIKTFEEIKEKYINLFSSSLTPQKRGYEFETLLQDLSKFSNLEVTEPFKVNGEQIDGAIKYDGEHYIIEAKWQDKEASNEPVYQFAGKVEGKMYGRGIFISVNGFSENVVKSLVTGKSIQTILVDGADIMLVVEGFIKFSEMIDKKVKAAQTKGFIYIDSTNGKSKI